jgi:hypothetical protein
MLKLHSSGAGSQSKSRQSRGKPAGLLRQLLPPSGRAAAGVESAAKRKMASRDSIESAVERLERADIGKKPDLQQVARTAGLSFATVWRHCKDDPQLAARLQLGRAPERLNDRVRNLTAKLNQAELVIAEQSLEISQLVNACRLAERKCEILETRLSDIQHSIPKTYDQPSHASSGIPNLRLVSDSAD